MTGSVIEVLFVPFSDNVGNFVIFHPLKNGFVGDVVKGAFNVQKDCQVVVVVTVGFLNTLDNLRQGSFRTVTFSEGVLVGVVWYLV